MEEIAPGLFHWKAVHEGIGAEVSSHFLADSGTLIDPMEPSEGLDAVAERGAPQRILLSNRHHYRHSDRYRERFGDLPVLCERSGLYEFETDGPEVEGFSFGDEVAPGVMAQEMDSICSEDTVFHIAAGPGFLSFADSVLRYGSHLQLVPDQLLVDDEDELEPVKRGIYEHCEKLLDLDFDGLLFAHGNPLPSGGRDALRRFVESRPPELS